MSPRLRRILITLAMILVGASVVLAMVMNLPAFKQSTSGTPPESASPVAPTQQQTPPSSPSGVAGEKPAIKPPPANNTQPPPASNSTPPQSHPHTESAPTAGADHPASQSNAQVGREEHSRPLEPPAPSDSSSPAAAPPTGTSDKSPPTTTTPPARPANAPADAWVQGLHFKAQAAPPKTLKPLGDLDSPDNKARLSIDFSILGAGIRQITLADYYKTREHTPGNRLTLVDTTWDLRPSMAIRRININGFQIPTYIETDSPQPDYFTETSPGVFQATIVDAADKPALRINRQYTLGDVEGLIKVTQGITNLSDHPLNVQIEQWGPGDLPYDKGIYGDFRRFRFGYLDPRSDAAVLAAEKDYIFKRSTLLETLLKSDQDLAAKNLGPDASQRILWPNELSIKDKYSLAWVATTSRYFGFAVFPDLPFTTPDQLEKSRKQFTDVDQVELYVQAKSGEDRFAAIATRVNPDGTTTSDKSILLERYCTLKLVSPTKSLAPGQTRNFDNDIFAGPLRSALLKGQEPFHAFNLKELVLYQMECAWCTFQPLAKFLLAVLRLIEGDVIHIAGIGIGVHDWGISIIILVIFVRILLHPLLRKGQVSSQRVQRQMARLKPEIDKLKEKYKDNPKKLQQEQMALYKEHNVNFAGCLGMLPMMLQSPIWIALYSMLYFAIELRQTPAFYGFFQLFGNWEFLADLSKPDNFINFGKPILGAIPVIGPTLAHLPLIGGLSSINMLPILMGFFMYFQQKYMSPAAPNLSPEQESQQKIMKVIFPLFLPVMFYAAPSGLNLYMLTSSWVGTLEGKYIRAHIESLDLDQPASGAGAKKKVQNRASAQPRKKYKSRNGSSR